MPAQAIPAYVVNLDRDTERLAFFAAQAERAGVVFERYQAVEGARLDPVAEGYCGEGADRVGRIGNLVTHRALWRQIAAEAAPWAAVFEDDVHLSPAVGAFLKSDEWLPADGDLVKFESNGRRCWVASRGVPAPQGRRLKRLFSTHLGAAGYLVSRRGAARLSEATARFSLVADQILFGRPEQRVIPVPLQIWPALCRQDKDLAVDLQQIDYEGSPPMKAGRRSSMRKADRLRLEASRTLLCARWLVQGAVKRVVPWQ